MSEPLETLRLMPFQERTARYAYRRLFDEGQQRFLVADEVGLGKTKVALGVIAQAMRRRRGNVLYIAPSMHITRQNLPKLQAGPLQARSVRSLCLEAQGDVLGSGVLLGLTPTKDLHANHEGDFRERALILAILERRWPSLRDNREIQGLFRKTVGAQKFQDAKPARVSAALREHFFANVRQEWLDALDHPVQARRHRRTIVGGMRAVLARYALTQLRPALVVIDEFQRMTKEFLGDPTPQVSYLLNRRLLVLSATPYDQGTLKRNSAHERHEAFLELVTFLNRGDTTTSDGIRGALKDLAAALTDHHIDRSQVESAATRLGNLQRPFMVRTERPPQAQIAREKLRADLHEDDLSSLTSSVSLVQRLADGDKPQLSQLIELWKSMPYPLSTIDHHYVTGRLLSKSAPARLPPSAGLSKAQLKRKLPAEAANARLRALLKDMGDDATPQLWLPPTLPSVRQPRAGVASKTLVFTSWAAAPAAIAATVNLVVEPPPRRGERNFKKSRLELHSNRIPTKSTYLLAAPLVRLADAPGCDPLSHARRTSALPSPDDLVKQVAQQLHDAGLVRKGGRSLSDRSLVDVLLELDAYPHWPRRQEMPGVGWASEVMRGVPRTEGVRVSAENARLCAEIAVAAPGTCAYRSLQRCMPQLPEPTLRLAALRIGHAITRLLGRPGSWPIVGTAGLGPSTPYWRRALRYCLEHDLQSVLDEYISLLVRDAPDSGAESAARYVVDSIEVAMRTTGRLRVSRPSGVFGTAQFARALGERDSEDDKDLGRRRGLQTSNPLLVAFNSPFPPFVLATTSTGQEGLDLHRYCRRIVHWNLPHSPQAMEQREGRVDRFLSLGVRNAIAELGLSATSDHADPWEELIRSAEKTADAGSVLAPLWHFGDRARIRALAIVVPFSREERWWEELKQAASWYRLVLGQPDPEALLDRLARSTHTNREAISGVGVDLRPPPSE